MQFSPRFKIRTLFFVYKLNKRTNSNEEIKKKGREKARCFSLKLLNNVPDSMESVALALDRNRIELNNKFF